MACAFLTAFLLYPPSYGVTRAAMLVCGAVVWFGLIALLWRVPGNRAPFLQITFLAAVLLLLPRPSQTSTADLREAYLAGLRHYKGVRYYWGGESSRGIDCSGLIRRGLVDALFWRGLKTLNGVLVRKSISLWWHDSSASALGTGESGWTQPVLETPTLQALDHSRLLPGDLAVTTSGLHIMAYLGESRWIEADPGVGSVIILPVSSTESSWLRTPMHIVRWRMLAE